MNVADSAAAEEKEAAATRPDQLFSLKQDPSETKTVGEANKEKVAEMKEAIAKLTNR